MTDKTELDISIEEVTHAVAEITKMDTVIAGLTSKYENVIFDVDTPKGMKAAKEARKEIREPRYLIENMRKDGKAPVLDLGRKLDGRANEMKERLMAIESPIDDSIKEEETRAERERQAKIYAEENRVTAIQERITELRGAIDAVNSMGLPSPEKVSEFIKDVEAIPVDSTFDEFESQALDAKTATLATLREFLTAAKEREAEAERVKAERAELATLRAAAEKRQAKEQAEREKADAAARKKREAEEAEQRKKLEVQRKEQAEAQVKIDAENKRIASEKATIEKQRKENEARKADKERAAADAAEVARKAKYPGDAAIIAALSSHFDVTATTVLKWFPQLVETA